MTRWRPQPFRKRGAELDVSSEVIENAVATAKIIEDIDDKLHPIFSLRHLAFLVDIDYGFLRAVVSRANEEPYRVFRIRKKVAKGGNRAFRVIVVPNPDLLKAQRWITHRILCHARPHMASKAFSKGDTLLKAAEAHCDARWIIKLDVRNFFESITELAVYRVFRSLGYQKLVSFEMARLCTRLGTRTQYRRRPRWQVHHCREGITVYQCDRMGHLPQGAPTSPMLANLAVRDFDKRLKEIANNHQLEYTRYADDLTFSTCSNDFSREECRLIISKVYAEMTRVGISPNVAKTRISPPGSRMVVQGLLVDGPEPRLRREFKLKLRQHIHFLSRPDIGPAGHARAKGFSSISGLKHHVFGLATFARQIEKHYGEECLHALRAINWPV